VKFPECPQGTFYLR